MATIDQIGKKWRLQIRRKGVPFFSLVFPTYEQALEWERDHEEAYVKNPLLYIEAYAHNKRIRRQVKFYKDKLRQMTPQEILDTFDSFKIIAEKYFSSDSVSEEQLEQAKEEILKVSQTLACATKGEDNAL